MVVVVALFASYMKWGRYKRKESQGPQYVWLAIIGSSNAESQEGAYRAAYLLLTGGLRMEMEMVQTHIETGGGFFELGGAAQGRRQNHVFDGRIPTLQE